MAHKKSRHRHTPQHANPAAAGERAILPLGALMFAASMSSWAQTADDDTKTLKPVVVKATAEAEPSGKDSLRTTTTRIGKGAFIGSDSQLVAPVTIGDGAYVGTGTTVTKDVPADALAIGRAKQETKEGYASRLKARLKAAKEAAAKK